MKRIALFMLAACCFAIPASAQKKKKNKKDTEELLSDLKLDTAQFRNSYGHDACECIANLPKGLPQRALNDSITNCINDAVRGYQMVSKLFSATKSTGDRNIVVGSGSDDYKAYYNDIHHWLKDSCPVMSSALLASDITTEKSYSENEDAMKAYNEGIKIMKTKDYAGALPKFQAAVDIDPSFVFAWDNLGVCCRFTGKYEQALQAYRHSLSIDPEGRMPLINVPVVYSLMEKHDSAIAAYQKILVYYPEDAEAYYGMGVTTFYYMKDAEKALPYLCQAFNIYGKEKSAYKADAEKHIVSIYQELKKNNKEDVFKKILKEYNIKTD